ncbi:MAG: fatty acyl-AMP ligase [Archangiaceae bacterium]|nr:fatty acyl-AMP ligase [Archangiaceae bacterium]
MDHAHLIAAIEGLAGNSDVAYTFLSSDGKEEVFTWDTVRAEAKNRAAHLRAQGLKKGDRLALVMPDGIDFVPTFLGAVYAGVIPVPLYPPLSLGKLDSYIEALVAIMNRAEPTHLATNGKLEQVLWSAAARVPSLKGVITAEKLREPAPEAQSREPAQVNGDDIVFLQFTSGSTSLPKGVEVTHSSLRANAWAIMRDGLQTVTGRDVGVSWLPLYHDMGLIGFVLSPVFHLIPVVFIPTLSFVRNATLWLDVINKKRGTITFAPNFAYALATKRAKPEQMARWDLSCMRTYGCGAEPINPTTMRAFTEKFASCGVKPSHLLPCYGMAEATLAISFIGNDDELSTDVIEKEAYQSSKRAEPAHVSKLADGALEFVNCGKAFKGHDVGAFDDQGRRLKDRQVGELWVQGPSVARGYFKDPEATARTFGGGWLRTGDLGYLVNGNVYITGRKKDLIIVNGRNYDPQRIEWIADEVPEVRRGSTVAFSVPGSSSEEVVVVVESRTQNPGALVDAVKQRINEQLQLSVSDVVVAPPGSLPKTSSGKIQRQKTRAQYLEKTVGVEGPRTLGANGDKLTLAKHVALSLVGRARHRVRRVAAHAVEIRSVSDAVNKLQLAVRYFV